MGDPSRKSGGKVTSSFMILDALPARTGGRSLSPLATELLSALTQLSPGKAICVPITEQNTVNRIRSALGTLKRQHGIFTNTRVVKDDPQTGEYVAVALETNQ